MISLNLYELRKSRGITQSYLAEVLGVSFQTVSKWENGAATPDVKYVISMSKFFGVTTDQILGLQPLEADYYSRKTETEEYWNDKVDSIRRSRYELWNDDYIQFLIQKVWKIDKKVNVLDCGCGNGYLADLLMPFMPEGSTYTGIDISRAMIDDARKIHSDSDFPARFFVKDVYHHREKEKYDIVICQAFLRELSNPKLALNNMISSLKVNGMIICIEVNRELDNAGMYIDGMDYSKLIAGEMQRKYWLSEYEQNDRDYAIGIRIPFMLREFGIKDINVRVQDKVKFANPDDNEEYEKLREAYLAEKGWRKDDSDGDKIAVNVLTNRGLSRDEAEQLTDIWRQIRNKIMSEKKSFLKTTGFLITYGRKDK